MSSSLAAGPEIAEQVGEIMVRHAKEAGGILRLQGAARSRLQDRPQLGGRVGDGTHSAAKPN